MRTIDWDVEKNCVVLVDQTKLPTEYTTYNATTVTELVDSIKMLRVRGAPALGAAGAYGVALAAHRNDAKTFDKFLDTVVEDAGRVANARPTAVNLSREVEQVLSVLRQCTSIPEARRRAVTVAEEIAEADVNRNKQLGENGATLLEDGDTVMTHCNAGALATVDWGTALGVVYAAHDQGKDIDVIANETRPLNQGSRITTVELEENGVKTTLIPDNASGLCMQQGMVDAVIVGADRVVLSGGDEFGNQGVVFNKIGTYKHAVIADRHNLPFVVAVPHSTIDINSTADDVEIEQRSPDELREIYGTQNAPAETDVFNPAFDATPMELVDLVITETGVHEPPLEESQFREDEHVVA